jgi:hypothetical protein
MPLFFHSKTNSYKPISSSSAINFRGLDPDTRLSLPICLVSGIGGSMNSLPSTSWVRMKWRLFVNTASEHNPRSFEFVSLGCQKFKVVHGRQTLNQGGAFWKSMKSAKSA